MTYNVVYAHSQLNSANIICTINLRSRTLTVISKPNFLRCYDNGINDQVADHGTILLVDIEGKGLARISFLVGPELGDQILKIYST